VVCTCRTGPAEARPTPCYQCVTARARPETAGRPTSRQGPAEYRRPDEQRGDRFTRASGGWAVQANPAGSTACGYCNATPLPAYFLGDRARSATEAGLANLVAAGTAAGELWLTSYPRGTDIPDGPATAQEVSATGTPLGPPRTLPAGQVIEQATAACC
jgi:hypothetical protein